MVSMRYAALTPMADYQNTTGPIFGPPHRESALERHDSASSGAEEQALGAAPEPSFPAPDVGRERLPPRRRRLPDCPHVAGLRPVERTPCPQLRRDRHFWAPGALPPGGRRRERPGGPPARHACLGSPPWDGPAGHRHARRDGPAPPVPPLRPRRGL